MEHEITFKEFLETSKQELPMENEITIEEYLERIRQELERFKEKYIDCHKIEPEHFPLKMTEGDWNEQELSFRNLRYF